jgi:serine/threonine-protein kinase
MSENISRPDVADPESASDQSLRDIIREEGAVSPARALDLLSPIASALDTAHGAGRLHLDVSPGNIHVGKQAGQPEHVYVTDRGPGEDAAAGLLSLAMAGEYHGDPRYAAPERVRGTSADGRADQYSLACVAFELLTGQVPFNRDDTLATLLAHASEPPPALSWRQPSLPAAADPVLARALAKTPDDRFATCQDFTDALRGELAPTPSEFSGAAASPDTAKAVLTPAAPALALRDAGGPGAGAALIAGALARQRARQRSGAAPVTRSRGRLATMIAGAGVIIAAAVAISLALVPSSSPPAATTTRPLASSRASTPARPPASPGASTPPAAGTLTHPDGTEVVGPIAFAPDGKNLIALDNNGNVEFWNTTIRKLAAFTTPDNGHVLNRGAFSLGSHTIAITGFLGSGTAVTQNRIDLWNTATRKTTATVVYPASDIPGMVALSPSGRTVAVADEHGNISVWNAASSKITAVLHDPPASSEGPADLTFAPDGRTLAVADGNGNIYLWNTADRKITATLSPPVPSLSVVTDTVAFSPDGRTIATAYAGGDTYLWNAVTHQRVATLTVPPHASDPLHSAAPEIAFAPDGHSVATAYDSGDAYLWDTVTDQLVATLNDATTVAFSPNGHTLATAGAGGDISLWHVPGQAHER